MIVLWDRVALAAMAFVLVSGSVAGLLAVSRRRQRSNMWTVGDKELRRLLAKAPEGHVCRNLECDWERPAPWVAGPPLSLRRVVRSVLRRPARSGGGR
jgi:hypothetical protein